MKLSISNIAWDFNSDIEVYKLMKEYGYCGLEFAPTRIFPNHPYDKLEDAKKWRNHIEKNYSLTLASMQSIWYGRQEKLFGTSEEVNILFEYTKKAINFAATTGCGNLVFGCPKNRILPKNVNQERAIPFFKKLGDYAAEKNTVIGIEPNPPIYSTNYINDTASALELIKNVDSDGFRLNLDIGTIIQNHENIQEVFDNINLINHIHISEPALKVIEQRELHQELKQILEKAGYRKFVSIEMGKQREISVIEKTMQYIQEVFGYD